MKNKITLLLCSIAFLFLVTGCFGDGTNSNNLKLETVTQAIESKGIKLISKGSINEAFVVLNKVQPYGYWIGDSTKEKSVNLYIYTFKSEYARSEAHKIFNDHLQQANLITYPNVYENKNVMVVYLSESKEVGPIGDQLKNAIQNL